MFTTPLQRQLTLKIAQLYQQYWNPFIMQMGLLKLCATIVQVAGKDRPQWSPRNLNGVATRSTSSSKRTVKLNSMNVREAKCQVAFVAIMLLPGCHAYHNIISCTPPDNAHLIMHTT